MNLSASCGQKKEKAQNKKYNNEFKLKNKLLQINADVVIILWLWILLATMTVKLKSNIVTAPIGINNNHDY